MFFPVSILDSLQIYILYVPLSVLIRQNYLFTLSFLKTSRNTCVLFLVPIFLPWFLCQCFQCFPKRMFSKLHWFGFKRLSWTFATPFFNKQSIFDRLLKNYLIYSKKSSQKLFSNCLVGAINFCLNILTF